MYKAYFKEPQLDSKGHCPDMGLCSCFGDHIVTHEVPKVFEINKDPMERNPIDEASPL